MLKIKNILVKAKDIFDKDSVRAILAIVITYAYYLGILAFGFGIGLDIAKAYAGIVGFAVASIMAFYFTDVAQAIARGVFEGIDIRGLIAISTIALFFLDILTFGIFLGLDAMVLIAGLTAPHFGSVVGFYFQTNQQNTA